MGGHGGTGGGGGGGTGGGGGSKPSKVERLEVSPRVVVVGIGEQEALEVVALDSKGEPVDVSVYFISADPEVALVDGDGVVTGRAKGQTRIEIEAGGARAVVAVTVEGRAAVLELPDSLELPLGSEWTVEVRLQDEDGEDLDPRRLFWSTSDPDVARVLEGKVVGTGWGQATLTASLDGLEASIRVRTLLRFAELGVGEAHTCGRTVVDEIYCWGSGRFGELGFPLVEEESIQAPTNPVGEGRRFVALTVGARHACALDEAGAVYCWGQNDQNQLGENRAAFSDSPVAIEDLPPLQAIHARGDQTCGLDEDGAVHCWGGRAVPAEATEGHEFVAVATGARHVCGLDAEGRAYCWGANDRGQLGRPAEELEASATPLLVEGVPALSHLASGEEHVCGIAQENALLHCWGSNLRGELGRRTDSDYELPGQANSPYPFRFLGLGAELSCAISDGAGGYCWGANDWAQSGTQLEEPTLRTPSKIVAGNWSFETIWSGKTHVCAITDRSEAYCWGQAEAGRLGVPGCGDADFCSVPQLVIGQR